jgi:hypothetical protein
MAVIPAKINVRQVNILAAAILLANGFSRLVDIPSHGFRISIGSVQWSVEIGGRLLFMALLALLVVIGAETIFRSHPAFLAERGGHTTIRHWILPGLAAFGGSTAISMLPSGPQWWLGLLLITSLLIASVLFEFYTIDREDPRRTLSVVGLSVLGLTLLAIIFNAISAASVRLAMALPVIAISTFIISIRLLDLAASTVNRLILYALGIGLLVAEISLPLSFVPISPVMFALVLALSTHTFLGIAQAAAGGGVTRTTLVEYALLDLMGVVIIIALAGR